MSSWSGSSMWEASSTEISCHWARQSIGESTGNPAACALLSVQEVVAGQIVGASPSQCIYSQCPEHLAVSGWEKYHHTWGCPRGVMVKAMSCGIVVREFVLQSRYYVHFRANTLGKGMNPLILPPAMGK